MKGAGVGIQEIARLGLQFIWTALKTWLFFSQAGGMFFGRQIFGQRISSYLNRQLGIKPYDELWTDGPANLKTTNESNTLIECHFLGWVSIFRLPYP